MWLPRRLPRRFKIAYLLKFADAIEIRDRHHEVLGFVKMRIPDETEEFRRMWCSLPGAHPNYRTHLFVPDEEYDD